MAMAADPTLPILPFEAWLQILMHLDYKDVISCSSVNHQLNEISKESLLWRRFCKYYWLETICTSESWRQQFIDRFQDFGRYISCYRFLKKAWDDLINFLDVNCPTMKDTLQAGVTEDQLNELESQLDCSLPNDYRCLYRILNGKSRSGIYGSEILGRVEFYSQRRSMIFIDFNYLLKILKDTIVLRGCLPLVWCRISNFVEFIPLKNFRQISKHSICSTNFTNLIDGIFDSGPQLNVFISGKNVTDWFTGYVNSLTSGCYSFNNECIYRFYKAPNCITRTGSIEVTASSVFLPEVSLISRKHFVFSYKINLKMDEDAKKTDTCKLETRHWVITNADGVQETVDGRGVVGEYPILKPGSKYSWSSLTNFTTTTGQMTGHFQMRNLSNGEKFDIMCPVFYMECFPVF